MKTRDFSFDLPQERIAQFPRGERGESRLMALDRAAQTRSHHRFCDLPGLLEPGSLLVFNNTRVRKARLPGTSADTGAAVEFLLVQRTGPCTWQVMVKRSGRMKPGRRFLFGGGVEGEIAGFEGEFPLLKFSEPVSEEWLEAHGRVPLPPYIRRRPLPADEERYQTVYAAEPGSAAAPTAGLHFTASLLERLEAAGMECAYLTLDVGLGTFLPVREENIEDHKIHQEAYSIPAESAARIERARRDGRKIVAVGTTSVRTLESAWEGEGFAALTGKASLFIYPGYTFKVVDSLITNFHTPESTLLMLVSAFAGRDFILDSYAEAVREGYDFFSYGDATLIR